MFVLQVITAPLTSESPHSVVPAHIIHLLAQVEQAHACNAQQVFTVWRAQDIHNHVLRVRYVRQEVQALQVAE